MIAEQVKVKQRHLLVCDEKCETVGPIGFLGNCSLFKHSMC